MAGKQLFPEEGGIHLTREFHFSYAKGTDRIQITPQNDASSSSDYYDLSGRRIASPRHGVYIHNHQKIVIP